MSGEPIRIHVFQARGPQRRHSGVQANQSGVGRKAPNSKLQAPEKLQAPSPKTRPVSVWNLEVWSFSRGAPKRASAATAGSWRLAFGVWRLKSPYGRVDQKLRMRMERGQPCPRSGRFKK